MEKAVLSRVGGHFFQGGGIDPLRGRVLDLPGGGIHPAWPVRTGIKFALAGILSLFFALVLRLQEPTWAVTTAFVLSTPRFVGAIAEKTVFRICGAILGALTGFVISAGLNQTPGLFLLAMGLLVGITTAAYGGTFAPYGLRQWGYTATLVATQGLWNPDASWSIGLARCEEICVGIVVATTLNFVLWPRFARAEFLREVRGILRKVAGDFSRRAEYFLQGGGAPLPQRLGADLARLREMIRLGAMESPTFRTRLPEVDTLVAAVGDLINAVESLEENLGEDSVLRDYVSGAVAKLQEEAGGLMETLAGHPEASVGEHLEDLGSALREYEETLMRFRKEGRRSELELDDAFQHARYWGTIHEVVRALDIIAGLLPRLTALPDQSFPELRLSAPGRLPREWVRAGIRGGLAVVTALVLVDWLRPPGGDLVVIGTYLLTAFSVETCRKEGDVRVYGSVPGLGAVLFLWFLFLLLMTPWLSNYVVMNFVLGGMLFAIGYGADAKKITPFQSLLGLLLLVGMVGLNAQQAVGFQSVVDSTLGLLLAGVISAFFRRTIFPVLPQDALRESVEDMSKFLLSLPGAAEKPAARDCARFALTAARAEELAGVLVGKTLSASEAERWCEWIERLRCLGGQLLPLAGGRSELSEGLWKEMEEITERVADCLRDALSPEGRGVCDEESIWESLARCRCGIHAAELPVNKSLEAIARLARLEKAVRIAREVREQRGRIRWQADLADTAL